MSNYDTSDETLEEELCVCIAFESKDSVNNQTYPSSLRGEPPTARDVTLERHHHLLDGKYLFLLPRILTPLGLNVGGTIPI